MEDRHARTTITSVEECAYSRDRFMVVVYQVEQGIKLVKT